MTRAPKADGSDSDVVLPHISTCDHDQRSARPWRPTGAGKPESVDPQVEHRAGALQAQPGRDLRASTSSSPSVSSIIESLLPSWFPLPRCATSLTGN